MKRTDRMDLAWELLDHGMFVTLSLVGPDGIPYGVPISPARAGDRLYFHCAQRGRKIDAMRAQPRVSLSCVGRAEVMPGAFNIRYQSVLVAGRAREVTDPAEKIEALRLICEKYCPEDMGGFQKELDKALSRTGIWEILMEEITTKG